jgi:hypothetical protein
MGRVCPGGVVVCPLGVEGEPVMPRIPDVIEDGAANIADCLKS